MRRRDGQAVQDRRGVGAAGGMEIRILVNAGGVARVGVVVIRALEVCIVALGAGERSSGRGGGRRGGARLRAVGAVVGVSRRAVGLVAVVTGAELLRFDVRPLLPGFVGRRGSRGRALVSPNLGRSAAAGSRMGIRRAVRPRRRVLPVVGWHGGVAVQGQILVEFVDVKGLHVVNDLAAQFGDVHVAEIDVLAAALR